MKIPDYINTYYFWTSIILFVCLCLSFAISIFIIGNTEISSKLTYGVILFLSWIVVIALLCFVSLIALYREVSRLHARNFSEDMIEKVNKIKETLDDLNTRMKIVEETKEWVNKNKETLEGLHTRMESVERAKEWVNKNKETLEGLHTRMESVERAIEWVNKNKETLEGLHTRMESVEKKIQKF